MTKSRTDGEGSVYQMHTADCPPAIDGKRPDHKCTGRWRAAYVVGYRGTTPIRKTVTANTKSGAATKLRELREKHDATTLPVGKSPTLEQWLNQCHSRLLPRRGMKESSLVNYRKVFDSYLIPLLGHIKIDQLSADHIEDAWQILAETGNPTSAEEKPLAPATIHHAHVVLSRCLRLAIQKKRLKTNPAGPDSMDAPSKGTSEAQPLATEDWGKVLDTAPSLPNAARWTVALALGLRQGEALGLRWDDVDLETGTLRVRQTLSRLPGKGIVFGTPKTERSKRTIVLPEEFLPELRAHRKEQNAARLLAGDQWTDSGLVFTHADGRPIDPSVDRYRWHGLLETAGVAPIKLHAARHTAATIMLLRGVDPRVVMDIMGWSQISTAANYQHAVKEAQRTAAAAIGAAVWGR